MRERPRGLGPRLRRGWVALRARRMSMDGAPAAAGARRSRPPCHLTLTHVPPCVVPASARQLLDSTHALHLFKGAQRMRPLGPEPPLVPPRRRGAHTAGLKLLSVFFSPEAGSAHGRASPFATQPHCCLGTRACLRIGARGTVGPASCGASAAAPSGMGSARRAARWKRYPRFSTLRCSPTLPHHAFARAAIGVLSGGPPLGRFAQHWDLHFAALVGRVPGCLALAFTSVAPRRCHACMVPLLARDPSS